MVDRAKDIDPLYWLGQPINAMTREALQEALRNANNIIDNQRDTIASLRRQVFDTETL